MNRRRARARRHHRSADPRVADFRDLKAGDRPEGTPRWAGPVIVEGVPAVERLLASPYRVRAVFGVPGRVAALDLPDDVAAYEADKWVLSEVIGFRLTRGVLASADRPSAGGPGRAAGRTRSRRPAPARRARGAQRRGEPGLDRPLGARAGHRRAAARPALRRPVLPPLGAGLDGAHPGAAVRRPLRLARRPRTGCTTPATRPWRSPRPPTPSTCPTSIRARTRGRRCCWARRGPGSLPRPSRPPRCGPGSRCSRGVDSLGVAAAAAIAFATLR